MLPGASHAEDGRRIGSHDRTERDRSEERAAFEHEPQRHVAEGLDDEEGCAPRREIGETRASGSDLGRASQVPVFGRRGSDGNVEFTLGSARGVRHTRARTAGRSAVNRRELGAEMGLRLKL